MEVDHAFYQPCLDERGSNRDYQVVRNTESKITGDNSFYLRRGLNGLPEEKGNYRIAFRFPSGEWCIGKISIVPKVQSGYWNIQCAHGFILTPEQFKELKNPGVLEKYYAEIKPLLHLNDKFGKIDVDPSNYTPNFEVLKNINEAKLLEAILKAKDAHKALTILTNSSKPESYHDLLYALIERLPPEKRFLTFETYSGTDWRRNHRNFDRGQVPYNIMFANKIEPYSYNCNHEVVINLDGEILRGDFEKPPLAVKPKEVIKRPTFGDRIRNFFRD